MAEMTKKSLVLTFGTAGNKEISLTITKPNDTLTSADVTAAMDRIIASNAYGDGDQATQKVSAKYVMQQVDTIFSI